MKNVGTAVTIVNGALPFTEVSTQPHKPNMSFEGYGQYKNEGG